MNTYKSAQHYGKKHYTYNGIELVKIGVISISIVLNIVLALRFIWSAHSIVSYRELNKKYKNIEKDLLEHEAAIVNLSNEIQLLKNDAKYVEKTIRHKLNFVKANEIFYIFDEK